MSVSYLSIKTNLTKKINLQQRVFDHLTLDLVLESEVLNDFEFEITGSNLESNVEKICKEYFNARNLRPLKIVIDGSPFA